MSCFCRSVVEGGASEQHKGPQSVFVEGLLEGGGVRTTDGATVFVCRRVVGGGGSEQQTGPQSLFVEIRRNKEKGLQIGCSKGGGQNNTRGHSLCL